MVLAAVQALLSINLRANQLVVGIGFNILALGATTLLYRIIFGGLSRDEIPGLSKLNIPGLSDIPLFGTAFLQQSVFVYVGLLFVAGIWAMRSGERRVGKECGSTCRARCSRFC